MSQNVAFSIHVGDLIPSPTTHYQAQQYLGSGAYGVVIKCRNVTTNETVALKVIKNTANIECAKAELATLQTMKKRHSDRFNIVGLKESFSYKEHCCLVFEHLDMDLNKFMQISPGQHLQLKQIRPILQQLALSLVFLKSAGIIHTDLKPDNIMMVDHVSQPLKVKLIDFGLAFNYPEQRRGLTLQTLWYRSPEILARYPFSGAIDIWSLGCIVAQLFMGRPLFPAYDETDLWNQILYTVEKPLFPQQCFWPKYWMEWRFMASSPTLNGLDKNAERTDLACFIDLLKKMLTFTPSERITPHGILEHPFIAMSHLEGPFKNSPYVKSSVDVMSSCQVKRSDGGVDGDQKILPKSLKKKSSTRTANSPKPQRKRKRDGATLDDKPSRNKRKIKLQKQLPNIVKAINNSEAALSSPTRAHCIEKRNRDGKRKRKDGRKVEVACKKPTI